MSAGSSAWIARPIRYRVKLRFDLPESSYANARNPVWEDDDHELKAATDRVMQIFEELRETGFYFDRANRCFIPEARLLFVELVDA